MPLRLTGLGPLPVNRVSDNTSRSLQVYSWEESRVLNSNCAGEGGTVPSRVPETSPLFKLPQLQGH